MRLGEACAYLDYDKKTWYRAKIVKIIDQDHCLVFLIDVGTMRYVNRAELKEIYHKFLDEPCLVARACLCDLEDQKDEAIDESYQSRLLLLFIKNTVSRKVPEIPTKIFRNGKEFRLRT